MGFRIIEGRSLFLNTGTRVQVKFRLNPQDEELCMLAHIRFRLRRPNAREVFFGLQFIEIDSDIKYKKNADKILRFVAEEQRRHLAKHTHQNQ